MSKHVYGTGIEIGISLGHPRPVRATIAEIRAVWEAISRDPTVTVRAMSRTIGIQHTRTWHIMQFLESAGYICRARRSQNAVRVTVPMLPLDGCDVKFIRGKER